MATRLLTTGCDKTTPASLMAAATVNIPAIVLSGGPMLNGWRGAERVGSGTVVWELRRRLAAGDIDYPEFLSRIADSAPSVGHCNTMGTASTMNSLAEALGMSLPGSAMIPGPYKARGAGPVGHPGGAEVVNMQPPEALIRAGIESLPCLGDGRQSGTSGSPSILNASPEAATGGPLALLETGDRLRVDLSRGEVRLLVGDATLSRRRERLEAAGGYAYPDHQTPWQEIQRSMIEPLDRGMTLGSAPKYRDVARRSPPRDNH